MYRTRTYKLFISHAWDYNETYDNLVELLTRPRLRPLLPSSFGLLEEGLEFNWENFSVPQEAPLSTHPVLGKSYRWLVRQIDDRIKQSDCLLLIAGMWLQHRGWIQSEIEAAQEFRKPIIAIKPRGQERMPSSILLPIGITETVGWNRSSITSAIRKYVPQTPQIPSPELGALGHGLYGPLKK